MSKNLKVLVGQVYHNIEGLRMTVTSYTTATKVSVVFDSGYTVSTTADNIRRGKVIDKFSKLILGVGIVDTYEEVSRIPEYKKWFQMLRRCYDPYFVNKHHTYRNTTVCGSWRSFSTFREWLRSTGKDLEGTDLDKDIIGTVKSIDQYNPETTLVIARELNKFLLKNDAVRGELPLGVTYTPDRPSCYVARCSNTFGFSPYIAAFKCPMEAHTAWKDAKVMYMKLYAEIYKSDCKLYENLIKLAEIYDSKGQIS